MVERIDQPVCWSRQKIQLILRRRRRRRSSGKRRYGRRKSVGLSVLYTDRQLLLFYLGRVMLKSEEILGVTDKQTDRDRQTESSRSRLMHGPQGWYYRELVFLFFIGRGTYIDTSSTGSNMLKSFTTYVYNIISVSYTHLTLPTIYSV